MRYFTRGLANGELTDDEGESVRRAYLTRLESIRESLPKPLLALEQKVDLHDSIIERIVWRAAAKELELHLVTAEPAPRSVLIVYRGALLGRQRLNSLREVARDRETEILVTEIDTDADGILSHRFLFWPGQEVTIDFTSIEVTITDRPDRRVLLSGAFVEDD